FLQHKESATGNPSFLAADSIYWVTRTLRYPVAQPAQIERCNKRMANSLSNGHKSPRRQGSASCSSYCSLGTRWKESRTGCPAFLSKFIVIGGTDYAGYKGAGSTQARDFRYCPQIVRGKWL